MSLVYFFILLPFFSGMLLYSLSNEAMNYEEEGEILSFADLIKTTDEVWQDCCDTQDVIFINVPNEIWKGLLFVIAKLTQAGLYVASFVGHPLNWVVAFAIVIFGIGAHWSLAWPIIFGYVVISERKDLSSRFKEWNKQRKK